MKVPWRSLHVIFSVLTQHWQQAKAKVYRRNSVEVLSRAVHAPGVIGDVEEAVLFTVGELSPRSPRGPPPAPLQMEAEDSERWEWMTEPRALDQGGAAGCTVPGAEHGSAADSCELQCACGARTRSVLQLMCLGQAAGCEAGLGQMILAEPRGPL